MRYIERSTLMLTSGAQIRAARALLGWRRSDLAEAAKLHRNSVAYWEQQAVISADVEPVGVHHIRNALAAAGVIAFTDPAPGVRFCAQRTIPTKICA